MKQKPISYVRSSPVNGALMPSTEKHQGEDLSDWLIEAARRPWSSGPQTLDPRSEADPGEGEAHGARTLHQPFHVRGLVALGSLVTAYLQFYYFDVMVQIASLPAVIVFV